MDAAWESRTNPHTQACLALRSEGPLLTADTFQAGLGNLKPEGSAPSCVASFHPP